MEVVHTRVFAAGSEGGNPCPVIPSADRLDDAQMQALARYFGLDTVFIMSPRSKPADIRLRFFVPDHEMGVSGHATIAAITVALRGGAVKFGRTTVETITGLFCVESLNGGETIAVTLEQNPPVFGESVDPRLIAPALKIDPDQILPTAGPAQVVSVSRAKILVPLRDWRVLDGLMPDFEALWDLCDKTQATGLYPFTRDTNKEKAHAEARQFPLRAGFPEDAATGVAAAALGAYLANYGLQCRPGRHTFRIAQGYAMGSPSLLKAVAQCSEGKITRTAIQGTAKIDKRERLARW